MNIYYHRLSMHIYEDINLYLILSIILAHSFAHKVNKIECSNLKNGFVVTREISNEIQKGIPLLRY